MPIVDHEDASIYGTRTRLLLNGSGHHGPWLSARPACRVAAATPGAVVVRFPEHGWQGGADGGLVATGRTLFAAVVKAGEHESEA